MRFKISLVHSSSNIHSVFISEKSASDLGVFFGDYIELSQRDKKISATVSESNLPNNVLGLNRLSFHTADFDLDKEVKVLPGRKPDSIQFILKKIKGDVLNQNEIN